MIGKTLFDRYAADPAAFRTDLLVDCDGLATKFGKVMDPRQRDDFAGLDASLMRCVGRSDKAAPMRAYWERARGSSKTTDIAILCAWAMAFSTRPIRAHVYAADKDQARLLRDAVQGVIRLNPWLASIITVEAHRVLNTAEGHPGQGGTLTIEASDVGSSFGITPDLLICEELVHWTAAGEGLWASALSSAAKRSTCLMLVVSNAGFADSWQWAVREAARLDDAWIFSRWEAPARWIDKARLDEQRRMLPAVAFARLWGNEWSSGGGDALTPADIAAAFVDDLEPITRRQPGYSFVAGVDLGLKRDSSAVVALAVPERWGPIRLATHKLWRPPKNGKVDLAEVEEHILALDSLLKLEFVAFDPWQAELLASRIEADSTRCSRNVHRRFVGRPFMREVQPTGANLREQAALVLEHFHDRKLQLYPCEPLRSDLQKLRIEERQYGYRCVSPRDGDGHGDTFSAFALALLVAHEIAGKRRQSGGLCMDATTGCTSRGARPAWLAAAEAEVAAIRAHREWVESLPENNAFNDHVFRASRGARGHSPFG